MSYNDMISTGIGGIAVGEQMFRLSSQLLDNQDEGKSRIFREIGGFVIDPVRGFNRAVVGPLLARSMPTRRSPSTGARRTRASSSSRGRADHRRGRVDQREHEHLRLHRRQPHLRKRLRQRPPEAVRLPGRRLPVQPSATSISARCCGSAGTSTPGPWAGTRTRPKYAFAVVQHFDYHNNNAYEFGQQAFGPSLFARYRLSDKMGLGLRWDGMVSILAAVNADYSFLADVGDRERFREYDYGPGLGTGLEVVARSRPEPAAGPLLPPALDQREQRLHLQQDRRETSCEGSDANHYLQALGGRLFIPVFKRLGLGADALVVLRKSRYGARVPRGQGPAQPGGPRLPGLGSRPLRGRPRRADPP